MDLSTQYLGLKLSNPLVASASPLSRELDGIRRLADAGAAAIVVYSLFEEQIAWAGRPIGQASQIRYAPGYIPNWAAEPVGPDEYLDLISLAKRAVDIPIIGSLNGTAPGEWTRYAHLIEGAGADALELNLYYIPTDASLTSADVEQRYLDTVSEVRQSVSCPVAVKICPYFSALPFMVKRLEAAGANALVLFNRYYEPDFDIETRSVNAQRVSLSGSDDLRLPLRWIALLSGNTEADLALTGGVHTHTDVLKSLMAGASVTMLASELMQHGVGRLGEILSDLSRWMEVHHYDYISDLRGILSARRNTFEPGSTERAGYINTVHPPHSENAAQIFV